jgi:hypothetical protein
MEYINTTKHLSNIMVGSYNVVCFGSIHFMVDMDKVVNKAIKVVRSKWWGKVIANLIEHIAVNKVISKQHVIMSIVTVSLIINKANLMVSIHFHIDFTCYNYYIIKLVCFS